MKVIKPPFGPSESVMARRDVSERQRAPHASMRPAVEVETAAVGHLYSEVAAERAARISALKAQVKSGTYRPNLEIVAERLVADLGVGLG